MKRSAPTFIAPLSVSVVTWACMPAVAQCQRQWLPGAGVPGTDSHIEAVTHWDPDGAGPQPELLVVGGPITTIGPLPVEGLAGFDGANWRKIGGELHGDFYYILSLAVFQGNLFVGGNFSTF